MKTASESDLTQTVLRLLFVGALIGGSFWVLRPFLVPLIWAGTVVVATWPIFLYLRRVLGESKRLAVAAMTVLLLLIVVLPVYLAISTIVENADRFTLWANAVAANIAGEPPAWVESLPLVGSSIAARWREVAATDTGELSVRLLPYGRMVVAWFAGQVGSIGLVALDFLMMILIAAVLFATGEGAAEFVEAFARRLAGEEGVKAAHLAAQAVRAVALGVVVTAVVQSAAGGIGLAVAGLPFVPVLTALMFIFGVAQIGPLPVLIPAMIWVYWHDGAVWGTVLMVWSLVVGISDNFLRPVLIRRGADLPLLLILPGVIGGLIAFGVIGLFIGPVVLAVAYTLLVVWIGDARGAVRA